MSLFLSQNFAAADLGTRPFAEPLFWGRGDFRGHEAFGFKVDAKQGVDAIKQFGISRAGAADVTEALLLRAYFPGLLKNGFFVGFHSQSFMRCRQLKWLMGSNFF